MTWEDRNAWVGMGLVSYFGPTVVMNIAPANVSRWVNEVRDPTGDVIVEIKNALEKIDPAAAADFVISYLYSSQAN